MKAYKKIGIGIATGMLALAAPATAQTPPLETRIVTRESKISTREAQPATAESKILENYSFQSQARLEVEQRKVYTYEDYKLELQKRLADRKFDYKDATALLGIAEHISEESLIQTSYNLKVPSMEAIEKKVEQYYLDISRGATPETKITNEEVILYMMYTQKANQKSNFELEARINADKKLYTAYIAEGIEYTNRRFMKSDKYWGVDNFGIPSEGLQKSLAEMFANLGYSKIKIEPFHTQFPPPKTRFEKFGIPNHGMVFFGLLFPILRNIALARFLRKNSGGMDYAITGLFGGVNGLIGSMFIDSLHPLVYPIRVFGTPFILQPLRKIIVKDEVVGN